MINLKVSSLGPLIMSLTLLVLIGGSLAGSYANYSSVPAMGAPKLDEVMRPKPAAVLFYDLDQDGLTDLISYSPAFGTAFIEVSAGGKTGWTFLRREVPALRDPKLTAVNNLIHLESRPEHLLFAYRPGSLGSPPKLEEVNWARLMIPKARPKGSHLVVDKSSNHLYFFKDGRLVKIFRVATGRDQTGPIGVESSFTPEGIFPVVVKTSYPEWFDSKTGKVVSGGAMENPLGSRWIGISVNGDRGFVYAVHGTNEPASIGGYHSDGCVRLLNHEVEELFDQVGLGAIVEIINPSASEQIQRIKEYRGDTRGRQRPDRNSIE